MRARTAIGQASASSDVAAVGAAEPQLRSGVTRLFAVAENYPELKSDASFQRLQSRITSLEEALADRRELYNEQVNLNNIRIDVFPDVLIARNFGFARAHLLDFLPEEKRDVDVGALFHA
jgi:LemA protein